MPKRPNELLTKSALASGRPHTKLTKPNNDITNASQRTNPKRRTKESTKARQERRKRQALRNTSKPSLSTDNFNHPLPPPSEQRAPPAPNHTSTDQLPSQEDPELITTLQQRITLLEQSLEEADTALRLAAPTSLQAHRERDAARSALEEKEAQIARLNSQLRAFLDSAATGTHPGLTVALEAQAQQHLFLVRGLQERLAERDARIVELGCAKRQVEERIDGLLALHRRKVVEYERRVGDAERRVEEVKSEAERKGRELRVLLEDQQGLIGRLLERSDGA